MTEERRERDEQMREWGDVIANAIELGAVTMTLTAESINNFVDDMVRRGRVTREQGEDLADRLTTRGREQRSAVSEMIEDSMQRAMERLDVARRSELDEIKRRLELLEVAVIGKSKGPGTVPEVSAEHGEDIEPAA